MSEQKLIPRDFIADLLDRVDITTVISGRVQLERKGKNYSACCPFHDEKTPSFSVSEEKQFYYCFGCGATGNAINFLMEYERVTFPESVEILANMIGIEVPKQVRSDAEVAREQEKKNLYALMQDASEFYQHELRLHPDREVAVNYLKARGLDGATAKIYGVGFAPPGWDNLLKALPANGHSKQMMIDGGLLVDQDGKIYDRFRNRITFPIIDLRGRVIGFGGRVLNDEKPKYLNSPETSIFYKNYELYGLYQAKQANSVLSRLLVVEGYMDVISLAQFGITYAVATLGTACNEHHLFKAFKHTNEIVFCFDGDAAGVAAARRALNASLTSMSDGRIIKFLFVPEGDDPDSLIRKIGTEEFERLIESACTLDSYLFDVAGEGLHLDTLEGRAALSKKAVAMINLLPRGVYRELVFDQLAIRTGLSRDALNTLLLTEVEYSFDSLDSPPDYSDIPLPSDDYAQALSPDPSVNSAAPTIENLLQRYALIEPDGKVWDSHAKKIIKTGAFKNIVRPKMYKDWVEHEKRRTVLLDDVQVQVAAAQKKGRGGLGEALNRYVYLNPSDTVWDRVTRTVVAVSHLKIAIADCFAMWVSHPEREEIPVRNFVFDPTQQVDPGTHINQFRGIALLPEKNDKRCERIVTMMMMLCNNDLQVFRWLRRWLAYPLINIGAKMETAVLCHSEVHGSGKSYFFDVVMRSIYGEYSRTVGQAQLEGQYNDWMSKVLYCVYEEVLSRREKHAHTGTIKQTITGKTVRIEKKFMSGWEESNHMNSVFLSNEILPLPVEPSDRRFLVVWPETKLYESLQRGVDEDLKNGGAAAFYQFLLDTPMQVDGEEYPFDEHTKPPMTEAKERLIEHGRPVWEVFYNDWARGGLTHNGIPVPYCSIRTGDLFSMYEAWCSKNKEHCMGQHKFSSFISAKLKKRPDLHYSFMSSRGKATFFIVGKCPEGKSQEEWLGACVNEFERIFAVSTASGQQAA